jgi:hypothetical protein
MDKFHIKNAALPLRSVVYEVKNTVAIMMAKMDT